MSGAAGGRDIQGKSWQLNWNSCQRKACLKGDGERRILENL